MFDPQLQTLAAPQRRFWDELGARPPTFTLYGGTAIPLRLGHRFSIDFDFFSPKPFVPSDLMSSIPYLADAIVLQSAANPLTVRVDRGAPVQVSYFGDLGLGQVEQADRVAGPSFQVASLIDMAGMKAALVTQRAELKDYLDIHALLTLAKIPLATMLSAAGIIYTYGTPDDVAAVRRHVGDEAFREAIGNAPPGILDERSWAYWQAMAGHSPPPPMPRRTIPD